MKLITTLIAMVTISFLSACQKSGQNESNPAAQEKADQQTQKSGPSDGGGGDTCNGKMIESYKVDITQLPEFQEFIYPIVSKLSPKDKNEKDTNGPMLLVAVMKNWYIIDCRLNDIPKERKGLFLETYQTAIHSGREVFIDSASYYGMEKIEKAKLLLHEMIMGYYLMKYLSFEDICKMSNSCSGDYVAASNWKMFRPAPIRALNSEDHQKIRNVTAWLWSQGAALNIDSFSKLLKNNDFDQRFGKISESDSSESKEIEVDVNVFVRMFKRYAMTKSFPKFCQFDGSTNLSLSSCETELSSDIRDLKIGEHTTKQLYLKMKITRALDKKVFEQEFSLPLPSDMKKIKLYMNNMGSFLKSASLTFFANWPGYITSELKEGMKSQMLFFMLDLTDMENPAIYQTYFQSYVWYSFETAIVERDGFKYQETTGYSAFVPDESESLFVENELLYKISSFMGPKTSISLKAVPK